jgi:CheY-like chemotaxis protein
MAQRMAETKPAGRSGVSRILIVDDDPTIVQMLADVLGDEGYEVATATQSLRAFDRAKEAQPDLILMDIMMPYLDGLDQIKLFSLDDDLKDIPIIVITAKVHALDGIEDLRALRIVDYLYKPFEISVLLEKIQNAIAARA